MKQLLSRENFELWLAEDPDHDLVIDHLKFLDLWIDALRNGGAKYVQDLKDLAYDHLKRKRQSM